MEYSNERKNRPVVTGLGMISAIGNSVNESWQNAVKGVSGIKQAAAVNTEGCYASLAAEVSCGDLLGTEDAEKMDRAALLCVKACKEAMADVVIAGGADAFASVPDAGFLSLQVLDKNPCSPFNRCNGITLGEGAGAVIVESYEHAVERGAEIYCDVLGAGVSNDAYHITAPCPDGEGQMFAIRRTMQNAGVTPADIGYINAHGTGTAKNDEAEFLSLHTVFDGENDSLSVSSTKALTGHCLGAAGAMEAVFSIKALCEGMVPPTAGFTDEDMQSLRERAGKIDFCPNVAKKSSLKRL